MTPVEHCDLTVHDGHTSIRLRDDSGDIDIVHHLTPSEAAAIIAKLARTLCTHLTPHSDRTPTSLAHPDNQTLRDIRADQEPAA